MKKHYLTLAFLMLLSFCSCDGTDGIYLGSGVPDGYYLNPIMTFSMPDPTVIKAADGYFYLFATEDIRNTPIYRSENLTNWKSMGTAFTNDTRPTFEPGGGLWAPDINYIGGQYVLYYSMSVWGGGNTCGIGVATSSSPAGPYTDHGKLFISNEIGVHNSIDPFYIEEDGKKYLFWGSFFGIYCIELSDDGLSLKAGAQKQMVAGTAFEAVYIHKHGGYYYMFASVGSCCEGVSSTYRLVVGRSQSLLGPYASKNETAMMANGYDVVVASSDRFAGPGHCSEIVKDDAGDDWIFYHSYDTKRIASNRNLILDKVTWVDGWPVIGDGTPSIMAKKPVFN